MHLSTCPLQAPGLVLCSEQTLPDCRQLHHLRKGPQAKEPGGLSPKCCHHTVILAQSSRTHGPSSSVPRSWAEPSDRQVEYLPLGSSVLPTPDQCPHWPVSNGPAQPSQVPQPQNPLLSPFPSMRRLPTSREERNGGHSACTPPEEQTGGTEGGPLPRQLGPRPREAPRCPVPEQTPKSGPSAAACL